MQAQETLPEQMVVRDEGPYVEHLGHVKHQERSLEGVCPVIEHQECGAHVVEKRGSSNSVLQAPLRPVLEGTYTRRAGSVRKMVRCVVTELLGADGAEYCAASWVMREHITAALPDDRTLATAWARDLFHRAHRRSQQEDSAAPRSATAVSRAAQWTASAVCVSVAVLHV